jgi:transmembrane sensor
MEKINKKALNIVVKYYQDGCLDTQKAIRTFKILTGKNKKTRIQYMTIAASIAVFLSISVSLYMFNLPKKSILSTTNNIKTYILSDGSKITLFQHSSIIYDNKDFKNEKRIIILNGKAFFKVFHDRNHPFEVIGRIGHIKVLGTAFEMDEHTDNTSKVYVENGKVCFSAKDNRGIILTKGMHAELNVNDTIPHIVKVKDNNTSIKKDKVFKFKNASIKEVLKELSIYYHVHLVTTDTTKHLSGEFEASDLKEVKGMLEEMLNIKIEIKSCKEEK